MLPVCKNHLWKKTKKVGELEIVCLLLLLCRNAQKEKKKMMMMKKTMQGNRAARTRTGLHFYPLQRDQCKDLM